MPGDIVKANALGAYAPSDNPALVYIASLRSENSRRGMTRYLAQIASGMLDGDWKPEKERHLQLISDMQWHMLRFQHVSAIATRLVDLYSPATTNVMLSAIRGVMKTAWKLDLIDANEYQKAISVENVKNSTLPAGRDVEGHEIIALLHACNVNSNRTVKDIRDAAIIAFMTILGTRRSEVADLKMSEFNQDTGEIKILAAKGNKSRVVYISNTPRMLLERWISIRGTHSGYLFERLLKGGKLTGEGFTDQAIYKMLKERAKQSGIKDFSPHDLRRTAVGDMLDSGVDMSTVANIVGHSSTDTTKRYDRRGKRVLKEASEKMDIKL